MANAHGGLSHPAVYDETWNDGIDHAKIILRNQGRFAVLSREALLAWFDGFLDSLKSDGYVIASYEVTRDYAIGSKQILFAVGSAKHLGDELL